MLRMPCISRLLSVQNSCPAVKRVQKTQTGSKKKKTHTHTHTHPPTPQNAHKYIESRKRRAFHGLEHNILKSTQETASYISGLGCACDRPSACLLQPLQIKQKCQTPRVFVGIHHIYDIVMYSKASASWILRCEMLLQFSCFCLPLS